MAVFPRFRASFRAFDPYLYLEELTGFLPAPSRVESRLQRCGLGGPRSHWKKGIDHCWMHTFRNR